jgi:hypothetical protein
MNSVFASVPLLAGEFPLQAHIDQRLRCYWGDQFADLSHTVGVLAVYLERLRVDFGTGSLGASVGRLSFHLDRPGASASPIRFVQVGHYDPEVLGDYERFGPFLNPRMLNVDAADMRLAPEVMAWLDSIMPQATLAQACHRLVSKTAQRLSSGLARQYTTNDILTAIDAQYAEKLGKKVTKALRRKVEGAIHLVDRIKISRTLSAVLQANAVYSKLDVKPMQWHLQERSE